MVQDILKIVEEQVINKTLNLEGIEIVKNIMVENKKLTEDLRIYKKDLETSRQKQTFLDNSLRNEQNINTELTRDNKELKDKADQVYKDSIKHEYEVKRGEELKEIVHMALRNLIITRNRFGGGDTPDGHGGTVYSTTNDTETEETS